MTCPRCNHANATLRRFCGGCGTSLERACARCAFVNDADDRFCGGCGDGMPASMETRVIASPAAASGVTMLSVETLRELLAEIAPTLLGAAALPDGAIDQGDLDRLFGGAA